MFTEHDPQREYDYIPGTYLLNDKRLQKANPVVEDETEEKIALEEVKQVEDYAKMASSERKKIDKKFKSAIKKIDHEE